MSAARRHPVAKKPVAKKLPSALEKRAKAAHAAAQARLVEEAREAIATIRARREDIAESYFDIGQALVTLTRETVALAMGYADVAALLREELDLSLGTAKKLIELATRVDRSVLRTLQQERAAAILALVDATPEDDTLEALLERPFPTPDGGKLDLRAAPIDAIKDLARTMRQDRAAKDKRPEGFSTTAAQREMLKGLVATVTRDKSLAAITSFRLVASRKAHGPLVESRIPLKEFARVVALLAKPR